MKNKGFTLSPLEKLLFRWALHKTDPWNEPNGIVSPTAETSRENNGFWNLLQPCTAARGTQTAFLLKIRLVAAANGRENARGNQ